MNGTQSEFEFMSHCMAVELTAMLMEEKKMTLQQALKVLYNSRTYEKLSNPESHLYFQSPGYVYSFLEDELKTLEPIS